MGIERPPHLCPLSETHPQLRDEWLNQMTMPMVVTFEAQTEGTYSLWFSVDDAEKQVPLHVVHGLPPGMAPPS